jgi:cullin 3
MRALYVAQLSSQVVIIFRYLRDKDVFENVYKTHLQKRLLDARSLSDEVERSMLTKLKVWWLA